MTKPTQEQKNRELLIAMGYRVEARWKHVDNSKWVIYDLCAPDGLWAGSHSPSEDAAWSLAPDFYTSEKASRLLINWIASYRHNWEQFNEALFSNHNMWEGAGLNVQIRNALTAPLSVYADAAWLAIQNKKEKS